MKGLKKKIRDNRYLNWLLVISNWCFQGIPNADKTEKIYKILFSVICILITFSLFFFFSNIKLLQIIILSFIIGHTLNWIINGNFFILFIHRLLIFKTNKDSLFNYLYSLEKKLHSNQWILYTASFGSICRGDLKDSSDIDISVVRKPGFKNALKSILFALKEKKAADFNGIPLEIYISDSPQNSIKKFGAEKNPVVIYDPENTIDKYYQEKLTIKEAKKINN